MPVNDKLKQEIDKAKKELQDEFEFFKEKYKKKIDDSESKEAIKNECNETIKELNEEIANKKHSFGALIKEMIEGNKALLYKILNCLKKEQDKILCSIAIIIVVVTAAWFFSIPKVMDVNRYKENKDVTKLCSLISETLEYDENRYLEVSYRAVDAIISLKDKYGYEFLEECVENNYNPDLSKYIVNKLIDDDKEYLNNKIKKYYYIIKEDNYGKGYEHFINSLEKLRLYGVGYESLYKIDKFIFYMMPKLLKSTDYREQYLLANYFVRITEDNKFIPAWSKDVKNYAEYSKIFADNCIRVDEINEKLNMIDEERKGLINKERIYLSGYIISLHDVNEYYIRTSTGQHAILSTSLTGFKTTGFFSMYVTDGGWVNGYQYYYEDESAKRDGDRMMDLYVEETSLERERRRYWKDIADVRNKADVEYYKIENHARFFENDFDFLKE